jgi:WD40 repeat protein
MLFIFKVSTAKLQLMKTFNSHAVHCRVPSIQSLSVLNTFLLIGTRGGDILQTDITNGSVYQEKPMVTGHYYGEVWGLATHPTNNSIFATSGDDQTVRIWHISSGTHEDTHSHDCIALTEPDALPDMSRALVFEPTTGHWLVAGLGGRLGYRKVGTFGEHAGSICSLDTNNLQVLHLMKVAKEQISDMAFSLNGETLAVASNDNFIYLIHVEGPMNMSVIHQCSGHSSFVTDVSISSDNMWMMSNDGAGEILYWNINNGKRESDIDIFQNVEFLPNTCPLSWETIGCWPVSVDTRTRPAAGI